MTTRPKRKKAKAKKAAKKKAVRKVAAKVLQKKVATKTRGTKPARRRRVAKAKAAKPVDAKRSTRAVGKSAPLRRHVLTSTRRPKAQPLRGSSRIRAALRRIPNKQTHGRASGTAPANHAPALIRDFAAADAAAVNAVAFAAFDQYRGEYDDWPEFAKSIGAMAELAGTGELIVAESDGRVVGAVLYFGPRAEKPKQFDAAWPVLRMLVVDPAASGAGVGRLLMEECIARARRDGASVIALDTSPIMRIALAMYLRLGFVPLRDAPAVFGVRYRIYLKRL